MILSPDDVTTLKAMLRAERAARSAAGSEASDIAGREAQAHDQEAAARQSSERGA
jgi:hypothetical protein